jgi:DedD protein
MRYTADATMEPRALRDVDRWKDRIEVRLDNRQVAFLFFGSALVACLLFILGVVVGKRLESRGRALAPEIEDPLALLDRVAATTRATTEVAPAAGVLPAATRSRAGNRADKPTPAARPEGPVKRPESAAQPALAKTEARTGAGSAETTKPAAKVAPPASPPAPSPPSNEPVTAPAAGAAAAKPPQQATQEAIKPKRRFTLQLGSFAERSLAESFARTFEDEKPYVVVSQNPEKGTLFRVRVGEYGAYDEAVAAKAAFEKRHNRIALVVGPL